MVAPPGRVCGGSRPSSAPRNDAPIALRVLYGLSEHSSAAVTDLLVSLKHDDERLEPSTPKLKARKRAQDKLDGPGLPPLVGPILEAAGRLADVLRFSIVIPTLAYVDRVREIVRNWVRIITAPQECDEHPPPPWRHRL